MISQNQQLKQLLAQGNLESALEILVRLVQRSPDAELRQRVLTLSGQFTALKRQQLTGLLEEKDYQLQRNRITAAVVEIVDSQQLSESFKLSESSQQWKKWAAILALLASIAGITGYTLRDFFWPPEPEPQELPPAEPARKDTVVVMKPAATAPEGGKNKVNIEVKDKAKVGNIITGDSNKMDIKQDF